MGAQPYCTVQAGNNVLLCPLCDIGVFFYLVKALYKWLGGNPGSM